MIIIMLAVVVIPAPLSPPIEYTNVNNEFIYSHEWLCMYSYSNAHVSP